MTVENPENSQQTGQENSSTNTDTQQAAAQAVNDADVQNMTPAQFRDWMDSLPDKIADAIDVKIGERRAASQQSGGSTDSAGATQTDDARANKGGFFGTGKSFGEWFFTPKGQ